MKHLDNNELGDRLYLVINFIFVYSNYIKNIDFNVNDPIDKNHFCGVIHLNKCEESILNDMEKYLTNILNINKNFDYWEIDKEKLFIEME